MINFCETKGCNNTFVTIFNDEENIQRTCQDCRKIEKIIEDIREDIEIGNAIVNYGEWDHTAMWKIIEPIIKQIIKSHLRN